MNGSEVQEREKEHQRPAAAQTSGHGPAYGFHGYNGLPSCSYSLTLRLLEACSEKSLALGGAESNTSSTGGSASRERSETDIFLIDVCEERTTEDGDGLGSVQYISRGLRLVRLSQMRCWGMLHAMLILVHSSLSSNANERHELQTCETARTLFESSFEQEGTARRIIRIISGGRTLICSTVRIELDLKEQPRVGLGIGNVPVLTPTPFEHVLSEDGSVPPLESFECGQYTRGQRPFGRTSPSLRGCFSTQLALEEYKSGLEYECPV